MKKKRDLGLLWFYIILMLSVLMVVRGQRI